VAVDGQVRHSASVAQLYNPSTKGFLMLLTLEMAERLIASAIEKADELQTTVCVSVVDTGGSTVALARMDGCGYGYIEFASEAAQDSAGYIEPTPGGDSYGMPLFSDIGMFVGAIAVAGNSNDTILQEIAEAGSEAI
jgi:uncharacterized protein GlcG (DUF336 family)